MRLPLFALTLVVVAAACDNGANLPTTTPPPEASTTTGPAAAEQLAPTDSNSTAYPSRPPESPPTAPSTTSPSTTDLHPPTNTSPPSGNASIQYPDRVRFEGVDAELLQGPQHCDWDSTWQIFIRPEDLPGSTSDKGWDVFVRYPEGIPGYTYAAESDLDRARPADAMWLSGSAEGYELWFSPTDPDYIHVVGPEAVEAWVRATEWGLCI